MPGFTAFEEERYAARVLTTILGGNMSSRLFQEIREKLGLCYYIGAGHHASFEYWIFTIRSGLSKENFAFWMQEIYRLLDIIVQEGITQEEFENAKNYLKWSIQMGIESSNEMADFVSSQWLLHQKIQTLEDILDHYEAVSKEQVEAILPKLINDQRRAFHIE